MLQARHLRFCQIDLYPLAFRPRPIGERSVRRVFIKIQLVRVLLLSTHGARGVLSCPHIGSLGARQFSTDYLCREFLTKPPEFKRFSPAALILQTSISADDREAVASVGAVLKEGCSAGVAVISFVTTKPGPLQDIRVRQALNYAVNKNIIVDLLMGGVTVVASQPVPEGAFGYDPTIEPYPYDPDRAKTLLAEAGYADGFDLTIEVTAGAGVNSDSYYAMVADDLRRVGVRVTMQTIPTQVLIKRIYDGSWEGDAFGMSMDTMPSLDALRPFRLHSCLWSAPWHCNPEDTPLIEAAMSEGDLERREGMVRNLLRRYHDDPPAIYMFQMVGFTGLSPRVKNFESEFGVYNFDTMDIEVD